MQVVGLPLQSQLLLMYYRADALEARGLEVPSSWDDLLEVAAALNGTDLDGDGQGDYGTCVGSAAGGCPPDLPSTGSAAAL
jgi:multiple sugar transport system substrate-binding protein